MIEGQIERCDKQKHIHTATAIQFNQNAYMHCFERCIIMVWRASKQARARISWKSIFLANFHALSRHWHAKEEPQMQKSAMQCMEKFPDGCSFLFLHSLHSIQTTIFSLFLLPLRCLAHKNNYSRQYTIYIYIAIVLPMMIMVFDCRIFHNSVRTTEYATSAYIAALHIRTFRSHKDKSKHHTIPWLVCRSRIWLGCCWSVARSYAQM